MSWFEAPDAAGAGPDRAERPLARRPAGAHRRDGHAELAGVRGDARRASRNGLAALGVRPRERVAVLMDSRLETVLALFGIVRAGAVAVPLNVSITDSAVAAMCADAACVAVFACGSPLRAHRCAASAGRARRPPLHRLRCAGEGAGSTSRRSPPGSRARCPTVAIAPDDECNLIYSSGTTALPKGIVHTHACRMHWAYDCGDRAALSQRLPHAVLARAVLEHQLGHDARDDAGRRHDRAAATLQPARRARASSRPSASRTAPSYRCSSSGCSS